MIESIQNLLLLIWETRYKRYTTNFAKFPRIIKSKVNVYLIMNDVFCEMTKFSIVMQVLIFFTEENIIFLEQRSISSTFYLQLLHQ